MKTIHPAFGRLLAGVLLLASPAGAPSIQAQNDPDDAPRVTGSVVNPNGAEIAEADFSKILVINNSKSTCTLQLRRLNGKNWATVGSVKVKQDYEINTGDEESSAFYLVAKTASMASKAMKVEVGKGYSVESNANSVWITGR
jgi:hypothetical protein